MDSSSMQAVAAVSPRPGNVLIDLCAAPGGKSFLAAYMTRGDSVIIARDIYDHKLAQLQESQKRLGLDCIKSSIGDAAEFDFQLENTADIVIVDAPCSGLGIIRKRPDIKLNRSADDITSLVQLQRRILAASWSYVKPGGRLLYSTCTLSRRENEENFAWLLENYPFDTTDISDTLPDFKTARDGYVTILPQNYGSDGFFIAVAKRRMRNE